MVNSIRLCGILVILTASANALPPVIVPTNLQTNNISGYFPPTSMINNIQKNGNYIFGQVTGGAFILDTSNNQLSTHSFIGGGNLAGFGNNRVYGADRFVDLSSRNESLLSLANPPPNLTSFGISGANGNRVYGSYMSDQINPTTGMRMPYSENFFGIVNSNNTINWTTAPSTDSGGSYYFKSIFGNFAYGSYMEYDPIKNPNSTTKGLIYDLTSGNKTLLDVPSTFGSRIEAMSDNLIFGSYEYVVSNGSGGSGPGAPGRVLETRGYVYDGVNFFTLAFNDPTAADGYDYASLRSVSADGSEVVVSTGSNGQYIVGQVPEPSALSLLALGLGGLAMIRRRRS